MSSEPSNDSNRRPPESRTTTTYDAMGKVLSVCEDGATMTFTYDGTPAVACRRDDPADPPCASVPPQPVLTHTFEFRLTGTETQEQSVPVVAALKPAACILATGAVRTYLTRTAESAAGSTIGGVEVGAELRASGIVCRASLSDFGPGDLVVVQVEVAVYKTRNHE